MEALQKKIKLQNTLVDEKIIFITYAHNIDPQTGSVVKASQQIINTNLVQTTNNLNDLVNKMCDYNEPIALDTEFSSLAFYMSNILLISIEIGGWLYVVDCTTVHDWRDIFKNNEDKTYIAHNAQVEYSILKQHGVVLRKFYDTMIVEQRLWGGAGLQHNLQEVWHRKNRIVDRKILRYVLMCNKDISNQFIGGDENFVFTHEQVVYSATDVAALRHIMYNQQEYIDRYDMRFLLEGIEFPLIPILADAALDYGFRLDEEKWKSLIEKNKTNKYECEVKLDHITKELFQKYEVTKQLIKEGNINGVTKMPELRKIRRRSTEASQLSLFGDSRPLTSNYKQSNYINYGSTKQVLDVFKLLDEPVPLTYDNKKKELKESIGESALQQYLIENPSTILKEFIEVLLELKKYVKRIDNYGNRYLVSTFYDSSGKRKLGFKNPVTGNVHTVYKQCFTNNSRLSSGDEKHGKINIQNQPRENDYRTCFAGRPGYYVSTLDLSGAELTITAAKAKDMTMLEKGILEGDLHSPLAQGAWRKIYKHRKELVEKKLRAKNWDGVIETDDKSLKPLISKYLEYAHKEKHLVITKDQNKDLRQSGKNVNFGIIYGAKAPKVGKTNNISKTEGQITIDNHWEMIPNAMHLSNQFATFAITHGYVLHNTRTNSRRWFPKVKQGRLTDGEKISIENEARNSPISGTQADMIKEAMVEIDAYIRKNNIDAQLLGQIHDELVYDHKDKEFHEDIKRIMAEVANRYLEGFCEMQVEGHLGTTWKK